MELAYLDVNQINSSTFVHQLTDVYDTHLVDKVAIFI